MFSPLTSAAVRCSAKSFLRILPTTSRSAQSLLRTQLRPRPAHAFFQQNVRLNARSRSSRSTKSALITSSEPTVANTAEQPRLYERLRAAGRISNDEAPPVMTAGQRLFRPALFTATVIGGSLYYGYTWHSPNPSERWFPTVPAAFATVASIMAINTAVFIAWRIPLPITWRVLNRFFMSVPAVPYSASMLGSVFSHQSLSHLAMNMIVLYTFGTSLCEQIGSGAFMALYLSGGVFSSLASLAYNVILQRYHVCTLGASGAISALIGTYAYINPDHELCLIFLPFLALKAKYFVGLLAAIETVGIARGWQVVDHVAHLSGLGWGVGFGCLMMMEFRRRLERKKEIQRFCWW